MKQIQISETLKLIPRLCGIIKNIIEETGKGSEYLKEVEEAEDQYLNWYEKGNGNTSKIVFQRGAIPFFEQGNEMKRDFTGEDIARNLGGSAFVYWLSEKQQAERDNQSLNYHLIVTRQGMSWTAFYSIEEFNLWLAAYGCKLENEIKPGESSKILFPDSINKFQPLNAVLRYGAPDYHFQIFRNIKDEDREQIEGRIKQIANFKQTTTP